MKHCNNCSKCCDVIMLDGQSPEDIAHLLEEKRLDPIYEGILKPITREHAIAKNEKAVLEREAFRGRYPVYFYSCSHIENGRCGIYDKRPTMCSTYPFTERNITEENKNSHAWLSKVQYVHKQPQYSPTCTYVPTLIPVVNI